MFVCLVFNGFNVLFNLCLLKGFYFSTISNQHPQVIRTAEKSLYGGAKKSWGMCLKDLQQLSHKSLQALLDNTTHLCQPLSQNTIHLGNILLLFLHRIGIELDIATKIKRRFFFVGVRSY